MNKPKDIQVLKRDGTREPYDISKIKKSIEFATEGQGVNALQLEASIDHVLKNGIRTSEIQDNVIRHALQQATPQEPQWTKVAGRALAMQMWADFSLRGKSLYEIIKYNVRKGEYTGELLDFYSESDINFLSSKIDFLLDLDHSHASLITGMKKYLGKYELNQHMHMVNAMRFGQLEPAETRLQFVVDAYLAFAKRKISMATPFLSNLRKAGNVASCFTLRIADDTDSIFENIHRMAKISKNGGGLGVFMGEIRAKGSEVGGNPNAANSVVQWVKIINDTLVAVNQLGRRAGAGSVALPIWHNDILDFMDMQTEHGDTRSKSYDVFPQVTVPDIFMRRDAEQGPWTTFCPYEVEKKLGINPNAIWGAEFEAAYLKIEAAAAAGKLKVTRTFPSARDLTKIIMRNQFETGLPYIAFTDTINSVNPNSHDGMITNVNLCTESFSNTSADEYAHVCNLCSINLSNVDSMDELGKLSRLAARVLDHGIGLTNNPDSITTAHNARYRTIGIGQMGLHDYFAKNRLNFGSLTEVAEISECIEYNAAIESTELARVHGSYGAFAGGAWETGAMTARFSEHGCGKYDWTLVQDRINQFGMRNSQLTSPAPTTSTSIYQDCSASILPIYGAFFRDDNANGQMISTAKFLSEYPIAYGKTFSKHTAKEIIDVVAAAQPFIDTGCSMELIFDQNREDFKAKDLYDAIHYAHAKKIKSIYYIRSIKKNSTLENREADCAACAG